jgi:hypothetical protein
LSAYCMFQLLIAIIWSLGVMLVMCVLETVKW